MAPTFTYGDLNSDQTTTTNDGLRNVANTAANFACDLYQNYAQATTGFGDPTGLGGFLNGIYSHLCGPRNKTPAAPPVAPFNGGQCLNKSYKVTTRVTKPDTSTYTTLWPSLNGPIKGVQIIQNPSSAWQYGVISTGTSPLAGDVMNPEVSSNFRSGLDGYKVEIISIVRNDGLPDNCGDPSPQFPSPPPKTTDLNKTTNVNIGAGVVIAAPVTFIPVTNNANIQLNPQFQIGVGPFNVTFDAGGITVAPSFNLPGNTTSPTGNNGTQGQPALPAKVECQATDLTPVITRLDNQAASIQAIKTELDDVKNCSCPVSYNVNTVALGAGISGYVALPSNCIKVALTLNKIPANAKTQKSNGSEPTKYFCGYFYWGDGTGRSERVGISVQQSVFFPPLWATSFGWDLYLGYDCTVSATNLIPSKSNSELASVQMKVKPV